MTDENKNVENNREENRNKPEGNKKWWKNVGLKPNLRTGGKIVGLKPNLQAAFVV